MKKTLVLLLSFAILLAACNNSPEAVKGTAAAGATDSAVNPASDWKFGIALWTFHTFNFSDGLDKVDSAGVHYIEPNTFSKTLPELKDSAMLKLSPAGIEKLKGLIEKRGLKLETIYVAGDSTLASWVRQFEIAKQVGAKYVTGEPPINMWDSIDSLAGAYGIKVAIHEHWKGVSHYWNPDTVLLAIKNHPNFGACADLGHWPKSGIDPLEAVKKLAGHILVVHLKDIAAFNDPKLKDVPVGTGVVKFPAIFEELKKQGFKGYIYIERDAEDLPSNLPSVIQTVKYYNDQVGKLQ
ncbi:MAG: sugar phosphate isomerase/epimerase [Chitinophagaceae bacterium]